MEPIKANVYDEGKVGDCSTKVCFTNTDSGPIIYTGLNCV